VAVIKFKSVDKQQTNMGRLFVNVNESRVFVCSVTTESSLLTVFRVFIEVVYIF
jgi:hypothetical protein